jgi:hypothetical protein
LVVAPRGAAAFQKDANVNAISGPAKLYHMINTPSGDGDVR